MVDRAHTAVRLTRALELIEDARRSIALPRLTDNPERKLAAAERLIRAVREEIGGERG